MSDHMLPDMSHIDYMKMAIIEARKAGRRDEVPVGSVLVAKSGDVLSRAYNRTVGLSDPTAHAEILALRRAGKNIGNYRLVDSTLYTTIEPCIMCMGAVIHARVSTVVFGAADPKWGAAGSLYDLAGDFRLNHRPRILSGVCEDECRGLIQAFFQQKRHSEC